MENLDTLYSDFNKMYPEVDAWVYVSFSLREAGMEVPKPIFYYERIRMSTMYFPKLVSDHKQLLDLVFDSKKYYTLFDSISFSLGVHVTRQMLRLGFSMAKLCSTQGGIAIHSSSSTVPAKIICASGDYIQSHTEVYPVFGAHDEFQISEVRKYSSLLRNKYKSKFSLPRMKLIPFFFLPGESGVSFLYNNVPPVLLEALRVDVPGAEDPTKLFDSSTIERKINSSTLPLIRF